ncbi:MAG: YheU family protein [Deltaproteobacteria bacterium]|nr:YheU family protein [Deltaproteobacteria bacterium]MCW9050343.1 YheU family protein [Deltaproteobacteria bacterium]
MTQKKIDHPEEGIEVPYDELDPETLRRLIQEFVSRDGADWADAGCTLEDKVEQVLQQLKNQKVKVVFDLSSQTANLVTCQR